MTIRFKAGEQEYLADETGIHQLNPQPFTYDKNYVATYDTPEYKRNEEILCAMRYAFTVGALGGKISSILDAGYGNGAFMKFCLAMGVVEVYGKDETGLKVDGCGIVDAWPGSYDHCDVITFWDVLEHIEDPAFLHDVNAQMIVVSTPNCPSSVEDFKQYYHRKPDEHVHHWNKSTLMAFMKNYGWHYQACSYFEDYIRKPREGTNTPNILSMAFKRV